MNKFKFTLLTSIFLISITNAQIPIGPSLTASTSKFALDPGVIDKDLVLELISQKGKEVKKELMNRLILNCLECGSFATWNYARQSMNVLLKEKDQKLIKKELLRYTAELAIVVGISEFYLQVLGTRSLEGNLNNNEKQFLLQYFKWMDLPSKRNLVGTFIGKDQVKEELKKNSNLTWDDFSTVSKYYEILATHASLKRNLSPSSQTTSSSSRTAKTANATIQPQTLSYLPKVVYLPLFKNASKPYSESKRGKFKTNISSFCDFISPNHILIDMVYDICKNNSYLQEYGFFHNIEMPESSYKYKNKYLIFNEALSVEYGAVEQEIKGILDFLFGSFKILRDIHSNVNNIDLDYIDKKIQEITNSRVHSDSQEKLKKELKNQMNVSIPIIKEIQTNKELDELITNLSSLISIEKQHSNDQILFFINEKIKPTLSKYDLLLNNDLSGLIDRMNQYEKVLTLESLKSLRERYRVLNTRMKTATKDISINLTNFIKLIKAINDLDKPSTYEVLAKFMLPVGQIFANNQATVVLSQFLEGFEKYLMIDKTQDLLTINVESLATNLYERFGENSTSRLAFYFSLGTNFGIPYQGGNFLAKVNEGPSDIRNFYYLAEKVGIKYKLIDKNKKRAYGYKGQNLTTTNKTIRRYHKSAGYSEPFINDYFVFGYVSGLLYQIDFLNSESQDFTDPVYGLGFGVSFFNDLDASFSFATPMNDHFGKGSFWNISFDIKITEYLAALGKKNKGT